ncbi:hypothetical protein ACIBL8_14540 [Streptomyces sp. NPDC050523]|uniref:hypothetical protein n=1 Tax=Streptomyces sp. NPDC050523 TaxID=3365622 RepID=UPI0037AA6AC9
MDDATRGKLQIYAVENVDSASATCVVRCVGGIVRAGQQFTDESAAGSPGDRARMSLDWIERYGRRVEFIDPPNNGRVQLTGDGVTSLMKGAVINAVE